MKRMWEMMKERVEFFMWKIDDEGTGIDIRGKCYTNMDKNM